MKFSSSATLKNARQSKEMCVYRTKSQPHIEAKKFFFTNSISNVDKNEMLPDSPYSPHLAPSDLYFIINLTNMVAGKRF